MAEKIDRKQLKKPDEFQLVAGRAMTWVAAHKGPSIGVAAGIVALALLTWGLSAWRSSRESRAGAELAEAMELQSRPVAGAAQAVPGEQTFATADEREKAVMAALEKVRADHRGTTAAETALAELGFHKLKSGDAQGAQKDLQDFLSQSGKDHPLRPFAQESLGYALEAQNKLDDAKAAFEKLREMGLPARADYQVARVALLQGKPDARQLLQQVATDHPKEMEVVREANERLEIASLPPPGQGSSAPAQPAPEKKPPAAPEKKPQGKKQK